MDRRTFIGATVGSGLMATAGCTAKASKRPPKVPKDDLDSGGWELSSEDERTVFEQSYEGVSVTASAATKLYSDAALAAAIEEKTLGQVSGEMSSFFATRVTFDPNLAGLPGGVGQSEIVDQTEQSARETFKKRLRDAGLENVSKDGEGTFEVATGEQARRTDYTAEFVFDDITFPVSEDETIEVEGGALEVQGVLAVWPHDDAVLVSGGAFPAANFERHVEKDLTEAVHVSVDVDMGLTPEEYREELLGLIRQVE